MVIFDPDVYPMDTAWLNGESVRHHVEELERTAGAAGRR
jgi:hypothetical protein